MVPAAAALLLGAATISAGCIDIARESEAGLPDVGNLRIDAAVPLDSSISDAKADGPSHDGALGDAGLAGDANSRGTEIGVVADAGAMDRDAAEEPQDDVLADGTLPQDTSEAAFADGVEAADTSQSEAEDGPSNTPSDADSQDVAGDNAGPEPDSSPPKTDEDQDGFSPEDGDCNDGNRPSRAAAVRT